ncbi:MAG: alpha/beta hydrolase [Pyrinomonadaceae bacterium]
MSSTATIHVQWKVARLCRGLLLMALATTACGLQTKVESRERSPGPSAAGPQQGTNTLPAQSRDDGREPYLFYLHGRIIEVRGTRPTHERYGVYEYEQILETFRRAGFNVLSEARPPETVEREYAAKVVRQIESLLRAGVAPGRVTVVGASKGAIIAMWVSTLLRYRDINFVLMAGCNDATLRRHDVKLYGNVLSIHEASDEGLGTCRKFFEQSGGLNRSREIKLNTGLGHGFIYRPLKEWVGPAAAWAASAEQP